MLFSSRIVVGVLVATMAGTAAANGNLRALDTEIDIQENDDGNVVIQVKEVNTKPQAATCAEIDCNEDPNTGFQATTFSTCDDSSGTAVCGCMYSAEFGDVWPRCLGPAQDCEIGFFAGDECVTSTCTNWCETSTIIDVCDPGGENCCDVTGCTMLECNPNYRDLGTENRCTCPDGYELFHIRLDGAPYTPSSGCMPVEEIPVQLPAKHHHGN